MNKYLVLGGTGSLGIVLVEKLLQRMRMLRWQEEIHVASRGEEKIVKFRQKFGNLTNIQSHFCDVRDYDSVRRLISLIQPTHVINCSALKNVPEGEEFPFEFVKTNVLGTQNVLRACEEYGNPELKCLSVSTDKACAPLTSYGMAKALQERLHVRGNCGTYNFVRYGNVLESRGSVIPFFKEKISKGEKLPITSRNMTRFFLSLEDSVNLIFDALEDNEGKKGFIPKVRSALIVDLAEVMLESVGLSKDWIEIVGIRPGEKISESLISSDEAFRAEDNGKNWVLHDMMSGKKFNHLQKEYSSDNEFTCMNKEELKEFLKKNKIIS